MRISKRLFALVLVLTLVLTSMTVNAQNDCSDSSEGFTDVPESHWAYKYIQLMSDYGIINGYGDCTFDPSGSVSRAEFSKMMVKTLNLEVKSPSTPSFLDVGKSNWEYDYVETAKSYLTGFTTSGGFNFRPDTNAVREDMAVAIVKGLGINPVGIDESVLDGYSDANAISKNLRPFVAAAINEGVMIGSGGNFSPQGNLTRAQAATLLARLIVGEKVTFDEEEKVVFGDEALNAFKKPSLSATKRDNDVKLDWTQVPSEGFKYYKVVVSKNDSTPSYPDNGYVKVISDISDSDFELVIGQSIDGGSLEAGESYYAAITAVYDDEKLTSNVKTITMPGTYVEPDIGERTPELDVDVRDNDIKLDWTEVPSTGFKYYKVVVSKNDSTPSYSENGYQKAISNSAQTVHELESGNSYNGGDFGGVIKGGETYYIAITAVFEDGKYTSNVKNVTIPGSYTEVNVGEKTPILTATVNNDDVKLEWTEVPSAGFTYYKIVVSKYDSTPSYSENGYQTYFSDSSKTNYALSSGMGYNNGDFGGTIQSGQTYYVAITAVFSDGKYTTNVKAVTIP